MECGVNVSIRGRFRGMRNVGSSDWNQALELQTVGKHLHLYAADVTPTSSLTVVL